MASDINHVVLVGRLTRDPELKDVGEHKLGKVRLAVTTRAKKGGEWQDISNFFDVVIWGRTAENLAKYSGKGKRIGVTGRLSWREWTDKEGATRQTVEVIAQDVQFLEPKAADAAPAPTPAKPDTDALRDAAQAVKENFDADEIPF